jgi:hypothetical protein
VAPTITAGTTLKPKRKCCKDSPRCKKCPVVLKKLEKAGYAERDADGRYGFSSDVPKKAHKAARKR